MWSFKVMLIAIFIVIFFQDYKDRLVYWVLYPLAGILAFIVQLQELTLVIAVMNVLINLVFISLLLFVSYLYTSIRMKKPFGEVFGVGDILLFFALSFSFSIISFTYLFIFSLIFSLALHILLKNKQTHSTVPLAGYMSLFFGGIYAVSFIFESRFLYAC